MKRLDLMPAALALALVVAATPARPDDAGVDPSRNEVSVFGGLSILNARSTGQAAIAWPDVPWLPGWPAGGAGVLQVKTETELGNSALLGVRYSFYLRKQLALEADAAVAPSHDLRSTVGLCGAPGCYGREDYAAAGAGPTFDTAMDGFLASPMGGQLRGMAGMRAGEGRFDGPRGFGGRSLTAWHYGLGLAYDILGRDVRPYVTVGAGGVTYDGTPRAKTDFVLRFGGGLKVYFGRLGARVDVVDHLVFQNFLSGKDEHDVHFTGGAFVRF
jgi:hypothetical protein